MSITETAPQEQKQGKSLHEILNRFLAESTEMFPQLKGQLVVIDIDAFRIYGLQSIDAEKTGIGPEDVGPYLSSSHHVKEARAKKNKSPGSFHDDEYDLNVIIFADMIGIDPDNVSEKQEKIILNMLDHELAHRIIPDATYEKDGNSHSKIIAECITDAYTLIRHYQRFGTDEEFMNRYMAPWKRASRLIYHGDVNHFSAFVLEEITGCKDLIDFKKLMPQQTVDLAWDFAMRYVPPAPVVKKLSAELAPVREAFDAGTTEGIKALVDYTFHPETKYYGFRFGSTWLGAFLSGKIKWEEEYQPDLTKEYRADVSGKLKEREFKFAAEEILACVPPAARRPKAASTKQLTLF